MLLNEIIKEVGMTKRAVKYYEEKGLLSVDKDSNGYRNYSMQDVKTLKKISVYTTLKVPFIMGIGVKIAGGIAPETRTADEMIAYYRDMSESEYEKLKEMVKKGAKMKTGIMKYHPSFIAQRKMQKEFQDKGYNDIFIPNLMVLSPQYAEYKKALDKVNDRMCRELGLHYDSDYNLVIKNLE